MIKNHYIIYFQSPYGYQVKPAFNQSIFLNPEAPEVDYHVNCEILTIFYTGGGIINRRQHDKHGTLLAWDIIGIEFFWWISISRGLSQLTKVFYTCYRPLQKV